MNTPKGFQSTIEHRDDEWYFITDMGFRGNHLVSINYCPFCGEKLENS